MRFFLQRDSRLAARASWVSGLIMALVSGVGTIATAQESARNTDQEPTVDFAHEILPLLRERCAACHTNGTYQGGFSLDTRDSLLDSGAVDPDAPDSSDLLDRVISDDPDYRMPPEGGRLTTEEVAALRRWIASNVTWEPGYSFRESTWQAPIEFVAVDVPEGEGNPIDRLLAPYLAEQGASPAEPVADTIYLRRVYLDIIGLLPTLEEQLAFLQSDEPDKRGRLVESLLARRRDYADHWMTFWNDLLRNDYAGTGYIDGGRRQITTWLHQSLYDNKPYDQFVRELVYPTPESEGFILGIKWRGDVNASQVREVQFSQNVAQVFLGENMKCASCHDSFVDDWKLSHAYGLAAIVADRPLEMVRCDVPTGELATPAFLWPELGTIDPEGEPAERLQQLAELMTGPRNGRLARTIANRIWQRMMGRGLVEPVDRMGSEPWHPELLNFLAIYLRDNDYDLKRLIGLIASSRAYQLPSRVEAEPPSRYVFLGPVARRLTAEQFVDAAWTLCGGAPEQPQAVIAEGTEPASRVRAALVVSDLLMRELGRPNREQIVTTRDDVLSSLQALTLSNGQAFLDILRRGAERNLQDGLSGDVLVQGFFQRALCRLPTDDESAILVALVGDEPTPESLADMMWAVMLLPEFIYVQ